MRARVRVGVGRFVVASHREKGTGGMTPPPGSNELAREWTAHAAPASNRL